mmetsp:Transcript_116744/g.267939  ORF Transcript_116744/g.267939 Transcript_116744/m.267939 type:complete len:386 (+) Transcript_116744:24-1181(+)
MVDREESAAHADEEPVCRICLATEAESDLGELVSPCSCVGSQKFVHLKCLKTWQQSVAFGVSNHPQDVGRERRHEICGVCRTEFAVKPPDRAQTMATLADMTPEQIIPGMLLVTKRSAEERNALGGVSLVVRAYLETKVAHFSEAVYVLTEIKAGAATDGSDSVLGVNLSRQLESPDVSGLEVDVSEGEIARFASQGVTTVWMNGGPVKPRVVTSLVCVSHLERAVVDAACADGSLVKVATGACTVLRGSLRPVLDLALQERNAAQEPVHVLSWAGYAIWSRTQLLGEIARGSWGWCISDGADVRAACPLPTPSLWQSLRESPRLVWAPDNALSREFNERFQRATQRTQRDDRSEAVQEMITQFEALRRRGRPQLLGRLLRPFSQ